MAMKGGLAVAALHCVIALGLVGNSAMAQTLTLSPTPPTIFSATPTPADERDKTGPVGVLSRQPLNWQPEGFLIAAQQILPSATIDEIYDSNIFATNAAQASDFVSHLRPELRVNNGQGSVAYNLDAYGDVVRYADHGVLDYTNFGSSLGVVGDLAPTFRLQSSSTVVQDHSDPASFILSAANASISRLPAHLHYAQDVSGTLDLGRYGFTLNGEVARDDFDDIIIGGTVFKQSRLNATTMKVEPRLTYDITPLVRGIVQGEFRHQIDADGTLNSDVYSVATGLDFEFRRLFRGTATFGYSLQSYDAPGAGTIGSFNYVLDLAWYPTELMTVVLTGRQDFSNTILTSGTGAPVSNDVRTVQMQVDYELLRQLILSVSAGYTSSNFSSASRTDNSVSAGFDLSYTLTPNWQTSFQYLHINRDSTDTGFSYNRDQAAIAVKFQF